MATVDSNEPLFRGLEALGVLVRVTGDVDVMAVRSESGEITLAPASFPAFLAEAIREVGRELNLPAAWMNTQMASGLAAGMPPDFAERLTWRQFGGLHVGFVGRRDLIALKLEAASDDPPHGRTDVHLGDLVSLGATPEELDEAARWVLAVNVDPRRHETIAWVKQHVA